MRVFVSGAAGFLGSHLAERLLAEGHDVRACDNLSGGEMANVPDGIEFHQADCLDDNAMQQLTRKVDLVYHCAALAHEGLSLFSPSIITRSVFGASVALFSAAIRNGVRRIVYCSSMARYGENKTPFREEYPAHPRDPYGIAKVAAEEVLQSLAHLHGTEFAIAVPHNIIGPRQKYDDPFRNVASIMANLLLQGRRPLIYGDGEQRRCFSFVDDCLHCLLQMGTLPDANGQIINIGPDEETTSINGLARVLCDLTEQPFDPEYLPGRPCEVKVAVCHADKARRLLAYRTRTSLREGLASIVDHIRQSGPRPFHYHLPLEIPGPLTPRTWREQLF